MDCPIQDYTYPGDCESLSEHFLRFADDQAAWIEEFFPAFEKMIANGYASDELVVSHPAWVSNGTPSPPLPPQEPGCPAKRPTADDNMYDDSGRNSHAGLKMDAYDGRYWLIALVCVLVALLVAVLCVCWKSYRRGHGAYVRRLSWRLSVPAKSASPPKPEEGAAKNSDPPTISISRHGSRENQYQQVVVERV